MNNLLKLGLALLLASGMAFAQSSAASTDTTKHKDKTAMASTTTTSSDDDSIKTQVQQQLSNNPAYSNVQISVENGVVTLNGAVPKQDDRKQVKEMVKGITGVRKVKDALTVNTSASSVINAPAGASTEAIAASAPIASPADASASASTSVASSVATSAPITSATPASSEPLNTAGSLVGNTMAASGVQTGGTASILPQADQPPASSSAAVTSSTSGQAAVSASGGSAELQASISNAIKNEPTLAGSAISANVTDDTIELTGKVASAKQRQTANSIAQSFAQNRKVVDKLTVSKGSN